MEHYYDFSSSLDEEGYSSGSKGYDPDLHISCAIRPYEREFLLRCLSEEDISKVICPRKYKAIAYECKRLGMNASLIDIQSEKYYPILFNTFPVNVKLGETKSDIALSRSLWLSKTITKSNINLIGNYTQTDLRELTEKYNSIVYPDKVYYLNRLRCLWLHIRNDMYKKQQKNSLIITQLISAIDYNFEVYTTTIFCFIAFPTTIVVLDYYQVMMLHDTITSRFLTYSTCHIYQTLGKEELPSIRAIDLLYEWGDTILEKEGNDGYDILKCLEPICTGVALNQLDTLSISHKFFKELLEKQDDQIRAKYVLDCYNILEENCQNSCQLFEMFGCYRHWGHPTVNEEGGCETMREGTRQETDIDFDVVQIITGAWNRFFILNFISKNRRWPNCLVPDDPGNVINQLINNTVLNLDEYTNQIGLEEWAKIEFRQEFEFDYYPDFTQLLSDKSLSPYLTNFSRVYSKEMIKVRFSGQMKESRRVLLEILRRKEIDIKVIMETVQNRKVPDSWLIIGLHAKEREMKINARLFAMMVLEMRLYFCATEANVANNIFKYLPCQTMTWSEADLIKHLHEVSKLDGSNGLIPITFSIDYKKWNNMWRDEVVKPIFNTIDNLMGTPGLISYTHEFFQSCFYYLSSFLNPPDYIKKTTLDEKQKYETIKQADTFAESKITWASQLGGCEGLRQKAWTAVIGGSLLAAEYTTGVKSIITGQGDNQVIVAFFRMREKSLSIEDYLRDFKHVLEEDIKNYLLFLKNMSTGIGMFIKLEETWVSQHLFNYGKEILVDGIFLSGILKKISRTFLTVSDTYPSIADRLAAIHTTTHSSCIKGTDFVFPYFLAVQETSNLLIMEVRDSITLGRDFKKTLLDNKTELSDELLLFILILSKDFGGYPIMPFPDYIYRGHPDPITSYLVWLKALAKDIPIAYNLWEYILSLEGVAKEKLDLKAVVQDPTCLNMVKPINGVNVIKNTLEKALKSINKNHELSILMAHNRRVSKKKRTHSILEYLCQTEPFSPRVLNSIFSDSPEGACLDFISTFVDMRTVKGTLPIADMMDLREKLVECDKEWLSFVIKLYIRVKKRLYLKNFRKTCYQLKLNPGKPLSVCTTELAQFLRNYSWKREVMHVTVPHPLEQSQIEIDGTNSSSLSKETCLSNEQDQYILYLYHPPKQLIIPGRISYSRGEIPPYYGSHTQVKVSSRLINLPKTDRSIKAAQSLFRIKTWVCEEDSDFGKFLSELIKTRTDLGEQVLAGSTGTCLGGSLAHRFDDKITKHYARPNIRPNSFTMFYISSDEMGYLSIGLENYTIFFQGLFLAGMTITTFVFENTSINIEARHSIKQKMACRGCIKKLDDVYFHNDCEIPDLQIYKDSKILFSKVPDLSDRMDWGNLNCVKLVTPDYNDEKLLERRSFAAAYSIMGLSFTQTAPLIHSPYNSPDTFSQSTLLSIGCVVQIGIINILRAFGIVWFFDNILEISKLADRGGISLENVIKTLLLRSPKVFWSPLRALLLQKDIMDTLLTETGYLPGSSRSFTGGHSLDIMISNIVSKILIIDIRSNKLKIPLYAMTSGINAQFLFRLWINYLCYQAFPTKPKTFTRVLHSVYNEYKQCVNDNKIDVTSFYFRYNNIKQMILKKKGKEYQPFRKLPDLTMDSPLMLSRIGAEPWLKLKGVEAYHPISNKLKVIPATNLKLEELKKKIHKTFMEDFRYQIVLTSQHVTPIREKIHESYPMIRQSQIIGYLEHVIKTTGSYSSSHYKYLTLLNHINLPKIENCICIGEGNGGVSNLLITLFDAKKVFFNSLVDVKSFPPHRATSYYPPELLQIRHLNRIFGLDLCLAYGGNILEEFYRSKFITLFQSEVIDLITCDIESSGFTDIHKQKQIVDTCIKIINKARGNPVFIIKVYYQQKEAISILANQLLCVTNRVEVLCPAISSFKAQECFIVGTKQRNNQYPLDPGTWLNWDPSNTADLTRVEAEYEVATRNNILEVVPPADIQSVNNAFLEVGYRSSIPFALEHLTGDFLTYDSFLKNPLRECAETIECIHYLAISRLLSYGLLSQQKHLPSKFVHRHIEITSESRDLLNLVTFIHNVRLITLLVRDQLVPDEEFFRPTSLVYQGSDVFSYIPNLEEWMRKFGRSWFKVFGFIMTHLVVDSSPKPKDTTSRKKRKAAKKFRWAS